MAASSSFLFLSIILSYFLLTDGQSPGDLRLIRDGTSRLSYSYGRLQIYASTGWGEVCGDNFNITERNVACHQLGYSSSLNNDTINSYGNDVGSVSVSEVNCYGNSEYLHLLRCSYRKGFHNCQQNFVTLYCNSTNNPPYDGQLRLLYGTTSSNGLVQVYCNGQWGTVCGKYFTPDAAHLVCRQLGYTSAKSYSNGTFQGSYNTPIWLDNLYCSASPTDVCLGSCASCTGSSVSRSRCSHSNDLNVHCVYEALHYEEGSNTTSCESIELRPRLGEVRQLTVVGSGSVGVVQVSYGEGNDTLNKEWLNVCGSTSFDLFNAMTLCKQLGYDQLTNYTLVSSGYSRQFSPRCRSEQLHILWCPREVTYCNESLSVSCSYSTANYYTGQVRLVDGEYPSEGRLEIYIRGSWGTVSAYSYYEDYKIVGDRACRQLGYTGAAAWSIGTLPGTGTVWYSISSYYSYSSYYSRYYYCNPYYTNCFSRCLQSSTPYPDDTYYYENHYNDIAINCTFDVNSVVSVGSSTSCQIYVSPSPTNNTGPNSGAIVGGVIGSLLFIIVLIIILVSVVAVCRIKRLNKKQSQQRRPQAVSYAAQGQQVGFVPQAGYAIPPGTVLVPVAQGPMGMVPVNVVPQFVPAPVNAATNGGQEERKEDPSAADEVSPLPLIPPVTD